MTKRTILFVLSSLAAAGCVDPSASSQASGAPRASLAIAPPADEPGARLYRSKCSSCHALFDPTSRTRDEWRTVVQRMAPRSHLDDAQRTMLARYLAARARDASPAR